MNGGTTVTLFPAHGVRLAMLALSFGRHVKMELSRQAFRLKNYVSLNVGCFRLPVASLLIWVGFFCIFLLYFSCCTVVFISFISCFYYLLSEVPILGMG